MSLIMNHGCRMFFLNAVISILLKFFHGSRSPPVWQSEQHEKCRGVREKVEERRELQEAIASSPWSCGTGLRRRHATSAASPHPRRRPSPAAWRKGRFCPRLGLLLSCLRLVSRAASTDARLALTQQGCERLAPGYAERSRLCLSPAPGLSPREPFSAARAELRGLDASRKPELPLA